MLFEVLDNHNKILFKGTKTQIKEFVKTYPDKEFLHIKVCSFLPQEEVKEKQTSFSEEKRSFFSRLFKK